MTEIEPDLAAFASASCAGAGSRSTSARRSSASARLGRALQRRDRPGAHGRLDRRRQAAPRRGAARAAARRRRADRGRPLLRAWPAGPGSGRSAMPPASRTRPARANPSPPTAQHVLRQAKVGGRQRRRTAGRRAAAATPFRYSTLGVFVDMGRHQAVASTLGIKLARLPGLVPRPHLPPALMPGTARRARLVTDWTVGPAVRARLVRARPARPPAGPGARARRLGSSEAGGDEVVGGAGVASTTERARGTASCRFGGTSRSTRTGRPSRPSQMRSSGKRIVNVCTQRQRGMCSAYAAGIASSLARPFMRSGRRSARATRSPPGSSRAGSASRRGQATGGSADAELARTAFTAASSTARSRYRRLRGRARRGQRQLAVADRRRGGRGYAPGGAPGGRRLVDPAELVVIPVPRHQVHGGIHP